MKNIIFVAGLALVLATGVQAQEAKPETKKVCVKTTDAKTQKEVEKCRTVKIHEKHEGTKVPEKAPKK
mgnify:CR=1 FL=1|jgi:hypothetical protein